MRENKMRENKTSCPWGHKGKSPLVCASCLEELKTTIEMVRGFLKRDSLTARLFVAGALKTAVERANNTDPCECKGRNELLEKMAKLAGELEQQSNGGLTEKEKELVEALIAESEKSLESKGDLPIAPLECKENPERGGACSNHPCLSQLAEVYRTLKIGKANRRYLEGTFDIFISLSSIRENLCPKYSVVLTLISKIKDELMKVGRDVELAPEDWTALDPLMAELEKILPEEAKNF